ncbi:hypothetical protein HanIR_Chr06g0291791 [Helianthus annuus]|nr:hypothetical protein HanIR_Chr06g0291791 [Helianthus annuus]
MSVYVHMNTYVCIYRGAFNAVYRVENCEKMKKLLCVDKKKNLCVMRTRR